MKRIFAVLIFLGCMAFPIHAQTSGNTPPPPPVCGSTNAGALYTNTGTSPATVYTCGTTSTCSNTSQASPRIVWGTVALSGGTITVGSMTAWTSTSTFGCTCTDTSTTAASCTVQNTSSSSITIKGTSTDTVTYMCVGN